MGSNSYKLYRIIRREFLFPQHFLNYKNICSGLVQDVFDV